MFQRPLSTNARFAALEGNTHNHNGLALKQLTFLNILGFYLHVPAIIGTREALTGTV